MTVTSKNLVCFSPTKTTERIIEGISRGISDGDAVRTNLTLPRIAVEKIESSRSHLTIFGAPVYGGRIPPEAVHRFKYIRADRTPAVVVAVYGNRDYEDALLELCNLAEEQGFRPVAAAAFVGEHSYHTETRPIAPGRPDEKDLADAVNFGCLVREKLELIESPDELSHLKVPGAFPYREWKRPSGISPKTDTGLCTLCEECESGCPTSAITIKETVHTKENKCMLCSACVKSCPTGARFWDDPWIDRVRTWLEANCSKRKDPEMFL